MGFSQADYIAMQARLQRKAPAQPEERPKSKQREDAIQEDIEDYMKTLTPRLWWDRKRMDKPTTSRCGVPDFIGCFHGVPFAMEVKRPGEKPTMQQSGELMWLGKAGAATAVVHSRDEAIQFLMSL